MAHSENPDDQLLDDYLLQKMTAAEKAAFEQRLVQEPELLRELESRKVLIQGIRFSERAMARDQAKRLRGKLKNRPPSRFPWISVILLATIVGCVWLGYRAFFIGDNSSVPSKEQHNQPEPGHLQQETARPPDQAENQTPPASEQKTADNSYQLLAVAEIDRYAASDFSAARQRSAPEPTSKNLRQLGVEAFEAKAFSKAMQYFEAVTDLQEYPDDFAKLGFCYLKTGKTDKAISIFEKMTDPVYGVEWKSRGAWYLLLAYLKAGQSRRQDVQKLLDRMLKDETMDETIRQRASELQKWLK